MEKKFGFNLYTFLIVFGFWIVGSIGAKTLTTIAVSKEVPGADTVAKIAHTA